MTTVTSEPKPTEEINLGSIDLEVAHNDNDNVETVLTGLGPLKSSKTLMIKQKIQTCEILTGKLTFIKYFPYPNCSL